MLTELCQYLRNWFTRKPDGTEHPKYSGVFEIVDGELNTDLLAEGQYFRILGSIFNDGVHKKGDGDLTDESFEGVIWSMSVPKEVLEISDEIDAWKSKYGGDSPAMSPFQSESFGGYSYAKSGGSLSGGVSVSWQGQFAERLSMWRKI